MKNLLTTILILLICGKLSAQTLAEDAKGQSSIAFGGSSINFDIKEASLSANYSNFKKDVSVEKPKMWIWGISAYGANSEGTATLFSEGKFQPSSRLSGFIGIRKIRPHSLYRRQIMLSNALNDPYYDTFMLIKKSYLNISKININQSTLEESTKESLIEKVKSLISETRRPDTPASTVRRIQTLKNYRNEIFSMLPKIQQDSIEINSIISTRPVKRKIGTKSNQKDSTEINLLVSVTRGKEVVLTQPKTIKDSIAINSIISVIRNIENAIDSINRAKFVFAKDSLNDKLVALQSKITSLRSEIQAVRSVTKDQNLTTYLAGGFNSTSFTIYNAASTEINDRFVKTYFKGGYVDFGFNYKYGRNLLFGGTIGYERASNFDKLDSREYTIRNTDEVGAQQSISEKKYNAYSGDFRIYNRANFRSDILLFSQLGSEPENRLVWNILYARGFITGNKLAAPSQLSLGTGLNFYKIKDGSFLGGIYVQADDVFNEQNQSTSVLNRVSFGIVAKYAFRTILSGF